VQACILEFLGSVVQILYLKVQLEGYQLHGSDRYYEVYQDLVNSIRSLKFIFSKKRHNNTKEYKYISIHLNDLYNVTLHDPYLIPIHSQLETFCAEFLYSTF